MAPALDIAATANATSVAPGASSEAWEEVMREQLATWFDDPDFIDEVPSMTVSVGDNALCQLDGVATVALPPDSVFSVVCDPHNRRVFKNIKSVKNERVVSDCNGVKELEMDMVFAFQLPFFTGTFDAQVRMVHDRPNRKMTFALTHPGFMKKFEGYWQVEPLLVPASSATSPFPTSLASISSTSAPCSPNFTSAPQSPISDSFPSGSPDDDDDADWPGSASSSPDRLPGSADPPADGAAIGAGVRVASRLVLHQVVQPSLAPPGIFKRCIHTILQMATRTVLVVFQHEAARIRSSRGKAEAEEGEGEKGGRWGALFLHREAFGIKKNGAGLGKVGLGKVGLGKLGHDMKGAAHRK
ncbi:hypothetical protein CLOM_g4262 [Closterium sp. NIES-68]|nr:hypothetical protein CLOM_g4262 [Closterium sp. NIES-68]GJP80134.1 hypothetical protein CLOP_g10360 [Closterium sp. NIES-67]